MAKPISDKYEILNQIGAGGMGVVYKVRHKALGTILAIKTLPADLMENPSLIARFTREARVMGLLKHTNIVQSIDFDFDGSLYYLVMEYIEGKTLKQYVSEKGPLPLPDVLEIARQAASALAFAHNNHPPIIHRDIKPANLMIEDTSRRVVVMDFGIAKEVGGGGEKTETGVMLGTVKYCSPEQLRHDPQNPLDGRADIYSLGLVLYELYTGKQFFAGLAEHDVIGKLLYESQEHEVRLTRPTPEQFTALLTRAIAKNRQQRYQRMEELLRDLEACQATLKENRKDDNTDTTLTIVRPLPIVNVVPPPVPVEVDDLEQQIQQLQAEKERRLATTAQRQTQEAREQAARAGAPDYASLLFQQAFAREEDGNKSFRERNHLLAQTIYQEAIALFQRAKAEAVVAVAVQTGEQARAEIAAIRAEAERYGVRERARTFYGRALALQSQADDLWEHHDYIQASQVYVQARGVFEDACELARRELLREEATTARQAMIAAKEAAPEAAQFALTLFQQAEAIEQQANRAMELEEFTQARQLYRSAQEKYEQAHDFAEREKLRQAALTVQQQTRDVQSQADAAEAQRYAPARYQQAVEIQRQGDVHFEAQRYEPAVHTYTPARDLYQQAAREAEQERNRQITAARERAESARRQTEATTQNLAELKPWAGPQWQEAQRLETEAQQAFATQAYDRAAERYAQAQHSYEAGGKEAAELRQRQQISELQKAGEQARTAAEQAEAPLYAAALYTQAVQAQQQGKQRFGEKHWNEARAAFSQARTLFAQARIQAPTEKERVATAAVYEQLEHTRTQAEQAGARKRFADKFSQVQQLVTQGQERSQREQYAQAKNLYQQATQQFEELRQNALLQADREDTEAVRQQMERIREHVRPLQPWAGQLWTQAQQHEAAAEQAYHNANYKEAAAQYGQATHLYEQGETEGRQAQLREEAARAAQREQDLQTATLARQRMIDAQTAAKREGAAERFQELFAQAQQVAVQGQKYEQSEEFANAAVLYDQGAQEFGQLRDKVRKAVAHERAQAARRHTEAIRESITGLTQWAGPQWTQAQQAEEKAHQAFAAESYDQAAESYAQAEQYYQAAKKEAEEAQQRHSLAALKTQVEQAQKKASQAEARQYAAELFAQAVAVFQQAERSAATQEWDQARTTLLHAQELFVETQRQAQREKGRRAALSACEHAERERTLAEEVGTQQRFADTFKQAQSLIVQGQIRAQAEQYEQACSLYEQAAQQFVQLRHDTVLQVAQERAAEARRTTERVKQAMATLTQWAGATGKEAEQLEAEAAHAWQLQEYALAAERYTQATQRYETARIEAEAAQQSFLQAQREKEQQAAVAARTVALEAQQQAIEGKQYFPDRFAKAESAFLQASTAFAREQWSIALTEFTNSADLFQTIHHDTVLYIQQERAVQSRAHARALQSKTATAKGRQKRRADGMFAEAEQRLQKNNYAEAQAGYEEAAALFAELSTQESPSPSRTVLKYGTALLLVVTIGVVVVRWFPFSQTRETPTPESQPTTKTTSQESPPVSTAKPTPGLPDSVPEIATKTTPAPPPPPSLTITRATPDPTEKVVVAEGKSVAFALDANSSEKEPLRYVWSLDGKQKAESQKWVYQPDFTEGGQSKQVKAVVRDQAGRSQEQIWQLEVEDINRQPQITSVSPPRDRVVEMEADQKQEFTVVATDPDPGDRLVYGWFIDGEQVPCAQASCQFRTFASDKTQNTVQVEISDAKKGGTVQVAWTIKVKVPQSPLLITRAQPNPATPITVAEGKSLTFAVDTQSVQNTPLRYAWFLDGKTQRGDKTWTYRPDFTAAGTKPKEVKVIVSGSNEKKAEQTWRVSIQDVNQPPRVTSASPRPETAVELNLEEQYNFTVKAIDPDPDDRLVYNWFVNGNEVSCKTPSCRFSPSSSYDTRYTMRVDISDTKENGKVQVAWNINVKIPEPPPRSEPPPEPGKEVIAAKTVPSPPIIEELTRREVQDWLETYRRAWEGMCEQENTTTLLRLRITLDQSLDPTRRTICSYSSYRVALQNPTPRVDGKQATVTFDRVDTIDGRVMKPVRLTFTLEKDADGRIVRQR